MQYSGFCLANHFPRLLNGCTVKGTSVDYMKWLHRPPTYLGNISWFFPYRVGAGVRRSPQKCKHPPLERAVGRCLDSMVKTWTVDFWWNCGVLKFRVSRCLESRFRQHVIQESWVNSLSGWLFHRHRNSGLANLLRICRRDPAGASEMRQVYSGSQLESGMHWKELDQKTL